MDNYDDFKKSFLDKLDSLLEERYPNESRQQARRNKFVEDYEKRFEPVSPFKSTLNNWIYRKSVPELRTLLNICELLNAEPDYFLISSQTEFRKGAHSASELLGLPESVINTIARYKASTKSALYTLVANKYSDKLEYLLDIIFDFASNTYGLEVTIKNKIMLEQHLSKFESFELFKQFTAEKFKMVLNDMHCDYTELTKDLVKLAEGENNGNHSET